MPTGGPGCCATGAAKPQEVAGTFPDDLSSLRDPDYPFIVSLATL